MASSLPCSDPYVDQELLSTGPGVGLVLALMGYLLIPLAGALPDGRKDADRPNHDRHDQAE
ncbi:hypothetical protein ACFY1S_05660 [Micromonospora sp. NPDC000663]|uniref:hypothetical protein n=1 Tax=Micromonospora sp. NPDC000663 TaxID=3364218 RepID=UPI0036A839E1